MAGVLPGVKSARRRRIHQRGGGGGGGWLDFSAGGLGSGHDCSRRLCAFSVVERSGMKWTCEDDMLGRLAREAKERLDERLRAQRSSLIKRNNSDGSWDRVMCINGRRRELKTEVFGSRKKRALLRWATRISGRKWRESPAAAVEEEECAVCLEDFKVGETLVNLPCAHRFHSDCLWPWLQAHAICPCCRMTILP